MGGTQNVRPHVYLKCVLLFSLSVALAHYPKFLFKSLKITFTELIRGFLSWVFFPVFDVFFPPTINNPEGFRKFSAFAPKYTCAMPHIMQLCIVSGTYACPLNRRNSLNKRHTHLTRIPGSKCDTTKCKRPDRNVLANLRRLGSASKATDKTTRTYLMPPVDKFTHTSARQNFVL